MTTLSMPAHAKLNIFLRVLGRRRDGYHDVETLILPITLTDGVAVQEAEGWTLTIEGPAAAGVPNDEDNLVLRAAHALAANASTADPAGARISVEKRIPVASGLGGGSADAAATLRLLDRLWDADTDAATLARLGLEVGSDVPALLLAEPALVRGRGEVVDPVMAQPTSWVVRPFDFGVSSADAYAWWDDRAATGPDPGALIAAAEAGDDDLLGSALFNDLQGPVAARHPEVADAVEQLVAAGARGAVMSGSGPTVVALCSFAAAQDVADAVPGSFVVDGPPRTPATIEADPSGVV